MRKPANKQHGSKRPGEPRPVTASYLRNAATHYLSGRSASREMVRQTLARRAKRRLCVTALEDTTLQLIEATLDGLAEVGLLDDARFAEARAVSLKGKGFSRRRIGLGLKAKGVTAELVEAAQEDVDDLAQARRFAERKRLGRWRPGGDDPGLRDKDLRALARAGFGYAIAAKALAAVGDED